MQAREYKLDKHLQMDGFIQAGLQFSSLSKLDFEQQWVGYSFKLRWTQRWLFYPLNHRCSLKFYYHLSFLQISSLLSPCQSSMTMHASLKLDWNQKAMGPLFFPANILTATNAILINPNYYDECHKIMILTMHNGWLSIIPTINRPQPLCILRQMDVSTYIFNLCYRAFINNFLWIQDQYTGNHIAQAIENFHLHNPLGTNPQAAHGSATTPAGSNHPHDFQNFAHKPPKNTIPPGNQAATLIPGFGVGPGNNLHLFPLVHDVGGYHGGKPGADRIVIQHHPPDPAAGVHHHCA